MNITARRNGVRWLSLLTLTASLSWTTRAAADDPAPRAVAVEAGQFDPLSLDIHAGEMVAWTNDDDSDHVIAADDGSFRSVALKHGDVYTHRFAAAGRFAYADRLHPRMHGVIVVN